ncbi:hypothetical protein [Actinomyces trachealis]|uniref:hypothetical protein n=1 Tax=Actinomyces trachealis TaxID=2763540 RepID=UPI0018928FEE|nr:hypothetical protein [Actinomyces trachealis]
MGDLVVELYGQRFGVLHGDWRTFDLVPDPAAALHFGLDSTVMSIAVPPAASVDSFAGAHSTQLLR